MSITIDDPRALATAILKGIKANKCNQSTILKSISDYCNLHSIQCLDNSDKEEKLGLSQFMPPAAKNLNTVSSEPELLSTDFPINADALPYEFTPEQLNVINTFLQGDKSMLQPTVTMRSLIKLIQATQEAGGKGELLAKHYEENDAHMENVITAFRSGRKWNAHLCKTHTNQATVQSVKQFALFLLSFLPSNKELHLQELIHVEGPKYIDVVLSNSPTLRRHADLLHRSAKVIDL